MCVTKYWLAIKKSEITPGARKLLELEISILNKIGQTLQDKYLLFPCICRI
jgi:hypothetical protein